MIFFPKTNRLIKYCQNENLTEIANRYETDKGDIDKHQLSWGSSYPEHFCMAYTKTYEKYMKEHRNNEVPLNVFEVGIKDKRFPFASCKMWLSYFKEINLYGMDNLWGSSLDKEKRSIEELNELGVNFIYADQGNFEDWDMIANTIPMKFDFFIEDGSHWPNHMVVTLWKAIHLMSSGGYYFMEDIQNPVTSRGKFKYDNSLLADELLMSLHTKEFNSCFLNEKQNKEINNAFELVELVLDPHKINYLAVFKKK
jgi:hypothetical protein